MAKPTDTLIENADAAVIGEIAIPGVASLGWSPADHIFIHVEGQEAVGEFYASDAEGVDDSSFIEFAVADLPADSLLADIENQDLGIFDLNDLLEQADAVPETSMLLVADGSDMESGVAETAFQVDSPQESAPSAVDQWTMNMAFAQLTIVIDDESGPDTVAI